MNNRRRQILFISTNLPYPADTGSKIRTRSILRELAKAGDVSLLCPGDPTRRDAYFQQVQDLCKNVDVINHKRFGAYSGRNRKLNVFGRLKAFLRQEPTWYLHDFVCSEFHKKLISLDLSSYDLIFLRYPQLAYYFLTDGELRQHQHKLALDVDDLAPVMQRRRVTNLPVSYARLRHSIELRFLENYYSKLKQIPYVFVASKNDRHYLQGRNFPNRIFFLPNTVQVPDEIASGSRSRDILFCGSLSFDHNIEALRYFVLQIYPIVCKHISDVTLTVVGKNPAAEVRQLCKRDGIRMFENVPETAPYYQRAALSVVPLLNGAGTRVKILESMSFGTPVVSTTVGAEGLCAKDGRDLLVADDPEFFAQACVNLLEDGTLHQKIRTGGYHFVRDNYNDQVTRESLDHFLFQSGLLTGQPQAELDSNTPLVSVIIPTFNRSGYLKSAVRSVLDQTFKSWEMIIVDDGSSDDTPSVIRAFTDTEVRIRTVRQVNAGVSAARNTGVKIAKGKYVAFLDDDDRWLPEKLQAHVDMMEQRPECALSYSKLKIIRSTAPQPSFGILPSTISDRAEDIFGEFYVLCSMIVLRRDCFIKLGGFDLRYSICQDWHILLRSALEWPLLAIDRVLNEVTKDERKSLSKDILKSAHEGILALKQLKLPADKAHLSRIRKHHIARLHYKLGRSYREKGHYFLAARQFATAILINPFIGASMGDSHDNPAASVLNVFKSFIAPPFCFMKGVVQHGGRS